MIAAMNLHRHRQIHGLGQDQTDLPIDTIDVPVTEPVLEAPTNVSAPILFTPVAPSPVAIGPAVPSDFTPLTPAQLAAQGYNTVTNPPPPPPGYVYNSDGTLSPIAGTELIPSTTNEAVSVGGLQFPAGTTGIDDAGNPVNAQGQILSPTGAVQSGVNPVGVITPIAQAATKLAQIAAAGSGSALPTIYPAPAGAVLPAGAVGVNALGQPINAQGVVLSTTPLTGSSWFSGSTVIAGMTVPNVAILIGIAAIAAIALGGASKKK